MYAVIDIYDDRIFEGSLLLGIQLDAHHPARKAQPQPATDSKYGTVLMRTLLVVIWLLLKIVYERKGKEEQSAVSTRVLEVSYIVIFYMCMCSLIDSVSLCYRYCHCIALGWCPILRYVINTSLFCIIYLIYIVF